MLWGAMAPFLAGPTFSFEIIEKQARISLAAALQDIIAGMN